MLRRSAERDRQQRSLVHHLQSIVIIPVEHSRTRARTRSVSRCVEGGRRCAFCTAHGADDGRPVPRSDLRCAHGRWSARHSKAVLCTAAQRRYVRCGRQPQECIQTRRAPDRLGVDAEKGPSGQGTRTQGTNGTHPPSRHMPLERKWHRCRKSLGAWSDTEPNRMGALRIDEGGLKPEVPTDRPAAS